MGNSRRLKKEVSTLVDEKIIDKDTASIILARHKREDRQWQGEAFGFLAFICVLFGIGFIFSSYWTSINQDQRFWAAISAPLLSALMMLGVLFFDKKIPIVEKSEVKGDEVSAVSESRDVKSFGKVATKKKFRHLIAWEIKEGIYAFHALSLVAASFLVMDSFKLNDDYFFIYAMCATFLLFLSYVASSVSCAIVSTVSAIVSVALPLSGGWIELLAWLYLVLYLPFMVKLLFEKCYRSLIAFAWVWTICILFMIFKTVGTLFWQVIFFSLAASLTWMVGAMLKRYGYVSSALKILGGISVFSVLLWSGFGNVWQNVSGNWILWTVYILFLCIDAFLVFQMMMHKEGVAFIAGLTPFCMFISAICAMFVESGSLSVLCVSVYSIILSFVIMWKGWRDGNIFKRWLGFCVIVAIGAVRITDSSFSMFNRGVFFVVAGIALSAICAFFIKIAGKPVKKRRRRKKVLSEKSLEVTDNMEVRHE